MKIGDRVKTTPKYAKEFAKEFAGVITEISTEPVAIYETDGSGYAMATGAYHPTETHTVATIKTDVGNIRCIGIDWLMTVEAGFSRIRL